MIINTTLFFSQLLGLFFIIAGLAMLVRQKTLIIICHEMTKFRAISFLMGVFLLFIALFLVLKHNLWSGRREIVISLLGWYILIESLTYLFLPREKMKIVGRWLKNKLIFLMVSSAFLILGAYLVWIGFSSL